MHSESENTDEKYRCQDAVALRHSDKQPTMGTVSAAADPDPAGEALVGSQAPSLARPAQKPRSLHVFCVRR